jgi:hypothetical protein
VCSGIFLSFAAASFRSTQFNSGDLPAQLGHEYQVRLHKLWHRGHLGGSAQMLPCRRQTRG